MVGAGGEGEEGKRGKKQILPFAQNDKKGQNDKGSRMTMEHPDYGSRDGYRKSGTTIEKAG